MRTDVEAGAEESVDCDMLGKTKLDQVAEARFEALAERESDARVFRGDNDAIV